jgi:segregation and condensation protein B
MDQHFITRIVEAALLAANHPLTIVQLRELFTLDEPPPDGSIEQALTDLRNGCAERGIELAETASGYRFQVQADVHAWVARLWTERQTKYTRATLETLAIIAYRQPITRGEIEQVRGVAVSSNIIKALEEREWIRSLGHRDMPGRPELLGTTKTFLDYFGLKSLDQLPPLSELKDFGELDPQLSFTDPDGVKAAALAEAMSLGDAPAPIAAGVSMDGHSETTGAEGNFVAANDDDSDATSIQNDSVQHDSTQHDSTQNDSTEASSAEGASVELTPLEITHLDITHLETTSLETTSTESDANTVDSTDENTIPEHDRSDDAAASFTHDDSNIALVADDDSTGA